MTLAPGTRLGPYEILSPLGAGGMGEVWKARDTRLERTVAVKVLSSQLSASPESRQRFEREARTISQLSHPHICALYDVGREGEIEYLVMELLEGETLSERLGKGALPLEQTLRYGVEIADALDKAHRQGIVHRDLKPGNVMLTKSGVKLLDFGLAKASERPLDAAGREQAAAGQHPMARNGLTSIPTVAGSPNLTQEGTILGTFQYMAPEQLEGKEADARTDIFALGSTLYEMATGRKAFSGTSQASLISAIMQSDPPAISAVQPMSPPALDRVVKTCLAKDPDERWQSAGDLRSELKWIAAGGSAVGIPAPVAASRKGREVLWQAIAVAAAATAIALAALLVRDARRPRPVFHSSIAAPEGTAFWLEENGPGPAALSPDGKQLAFAAADAQGRVALYVRSIAGGETRPIPGAEGAQYPFWSPDSRSIGFFAGGKLRTIAAAGGPPFSVCAAAEGKGGSWNSSGVILFTPNATSPIYRVSEKGGEPSALTRFDPKRGDDSHRHPRFLPDGRHFLYLARSQTSPGEGFAILAASLDGEPEKLLLRSPAAPLYADGHLLFLREATLMARPFDAGRLVLTGEAVPIAERIFSPSAAVAVAVFSASQNGLLVYQTARGEVGQRLQWFGRDGKPEGEVGEPGGYREVSLSPGGKQAAIAIRDPAAGTHDLWIYDVVRNVRTRFTFDPGDDRTPVWSPDGSTIVFSSNRKGRYDLYRKALGGASEEEPLLVTDADKYAFAWSRDGKRLVFEENAKDTGFDVWFIPMDGSGKPEPFLRTKASELPGALSPDGRWLAYASDESGPPEVYVTSFPRPGRKWQVSAAGGVFSFWSADGKEILYQGNDGRLWAIPVSARGDALELGQAQALFRASGPLVGGPVFSPSADHRRILAVSGGQEPKALLDLVVNWQGLLPRAR